MGNFILIQSYHINIKYILSLFRTMTDRDALKLFRDHQRGLAMARDREMLNDSNDEILYNAAEELETIPQDQVQDSSLDE